MSAAIRKPRLQVYNSGDPVLVRFRLPYGGTIGVDRDFLRVKGVNFVGALERARQHYQRSGCRFMAQAADDLIMQLFV